MPSHTECKDPFHGITVWFRKNSKVARRVKLKLDREFPDDAIISCGGFEFIMGTVIHDAKKFRDDWCVQWSSISLS